MVEATAEPAATYPYDDETKAMTLGFNDLYVVSTEGADVFALNLNTWDGPTPYYLEVEGRQFELQPKNTYLVTGHGGALPAWLQAEEAEGRLAVLVERGGRYLTYSHDPNAVDEDEDEDDAAEADGEDDAAEE